MLAVVAALLAASLPSLHQLMASSPACLLSLRHTSEVLSLHDHLLCSLLQGCLVSLLDSALLHHMHGMLVLPDGNPMLHCFEIPEAASPANIV